MGRGKLIINGKHIFLQISHPFPGCRALTSRQGYVTSPNYPSPYPDGVKCATDIEVGEGLTLEITVEDMAVRGAKNRHFLAAALGRTFS